MNKRLQTFKYISADFSAAIIAWTIFYLYRKTIIEPTLFGIDVPIQFSTQFYIAIAVLPVFWITLYFLSGFYKHIYRRSRLLELGQTLGTSFVGVLIIFFALILDDFIGSYKNYYKSFATLLALHFTFTYFFRLILTATTVKRIKNGKIGFNTLIIGSNERALKTHQELTHMKRPTGHRFLGYIPLESPTQDLLQGTLPQLGNISEVLAIIDQHQIEEIIIAIETSEHKKLRELITLLQNKEVIIHAIPDMYDILSGQVKMTSVYSSPLVKISNGIMPAWQENVKRIFDICFSVSAILFLTPVYAIIALAIRFSSKGPIIFKQERIGKYGKPFTMYKFRSMYIDAEANGPSLSSKNDARITPLGLFLRKTHLDEIPQFYNVLKGDMAIVGPRPERQFYIDQLIKAAPFYQQVHRIRPGITSWGQVKYGYASNIEEMLERLPYDILYLKNISIYLDLKILLYTIVTCFRGEGK
ncbi:sugar transferase [Prolixibacteraceae bacterium JC049]|nr:sugar transferase [Prolixibacteraceae bacterium JC049]